MILIRGRTHDECMKTADKLPDAGKNTVAGVCEIAYTVGSGPLILLVELKDR